MVLTGLVNKSPMPSNLDERRKWLNEMVGGTLEAIVPGSAADILYVDLGKRGARDIPLAEVRMKSKEIALAIRRQFAAKKRAGVEFGKLFVANSVTLATRVRIDILRAMARQFVNGDEIAYVNAYVSRPILTLKKKDSSLRPLVLTFADALARFGSRIKEENLQEAYRRAGSSFGAQLQQNFVVLKEKQTVEGRRGGGVNPGASLIRTPAKKRQSEEVNGRGGNEAKLLKK